MKALNPLFQIVFLLALPILISAQSTDESKQLNYLFGNSDYYQSQNVNPFPLSPKNQIYDLKGNSFPKFQFKEQTLYPISTKTLDGFEITREGLVDEFGITNHILIKQPDISNLAKMPIKKY